LGIRRRRVRLSDEDPAATRTNTIASGPYATELNASKDRAANPTEAAQVLSATFPCRRGTRGNSVRGARPNIIRDFPYEPLGNRRGRRTGAPAGMIRAAWGACVTGCAT